MAFIDECEIGLGNIAADQSLCAGDMQRRCFTSSMVQALNDADVASREALCLKGAASLLPAGAAAATRHL
jgi:hypothetical protein